MCYIQVTHFKYKDKDTLKAKGCRKIYHANTNLRKKKKASWSSHINCKQSRLLHWKLPGIMSRII